MSSRLTIVPFDRGHLDEAALLLATRQRHYRERQPFLPVELEVPEQARRLLEHHLRSSTGDAAVAIRDGAVTGYLLAQRMVLDPTDFLNAILRPRSVQCNRVSWAAAETDAYDVIRALYAELASGWVTDGFFAHYVTASTASETGMRAWHSLGFGRDMDLCHRGLTSLPAAVTPHGVELRLAQADDVDAALALAMTLERHHAASPMFWPYLREAVEVGWREALAESIATPDTGSQAFLATRDGRVIGLVQLVSASILDGFEVLVNDRSTYLWFGVTAASERGSGIGQALVTAALSWAAQQRMTDCVLHVQSGNIPGARFWHAYGFTPIEYRLSRFIDERIAWVHA
jgi:ribosomal protein S18 acetylase RimI-like enzyme